MKLLGFVVFLTSVGVFLGGGTGHLTSLALKAAYNSGCRFQQLPIMKPSCQVSDNLNEYNVPLHEFLQRFTPDTVPQRVSASAVIFRNVDHEPEILLAQSKKSLLGGGGKWETIGGVVDWYGRETILHAALRGLEEETNVKLASLDAWVGEYTIQTPWMLPAKKSLDIMFLASVPGDNTGQQNITLSTWKHQAYCWASKTQLMNLGVLQGKPMSFSMNGLEVVPKDAQWGKMTYISQDSKDLALRAFDVLHDRKSLANPRQATGLIAFFRRTFSLGFSGWER